MLIKLGDKLINAGQLTSAEMGDGGQLTIRLSDGQSLDFEGEAAARLWDSLTSRAEDGPDAEGEPESTKLHF
jgi:hypothetical protein